MRFFKYHALGNDYLVLDPQDCPKRFSLKEIQRICDRHFGLGSDGILYGPLKEEAGYGLQIFNPDGSEAEKSGNRLLIFARYLYEKKQAPKQFKVKTTGGTVTCQIATNGTIEIAMGQVYFNGQQALKIDGETYSLHLATIGNPHCVVPSPVISEELAKRVGPQLESHPLFPQRTNVQFLKVLDRNHIQIEIWERGAGYTLASGSSSCAAAAVAYAIGLLQPYHHSAHARRKAKGAN